MAPQAKLKFRVWLAYYEPYFLELAAQCQDEIDAYYSDTKPCAQVIDCILSKTHESIKSNMQAASIFLGLMPVVLPFLAPTTTEMAILAQSWPFFFIVASLGTPAVRSTPLPEGDTIRLQDGTQTLKWLHDFLNKRVRRRFGGLMVLKLVIYLLALAAVANIAELSFRTDVRSVSGFRCGQNLMPLIWSELSIASYGIAALTLRWKRKRYHLARDDAAAADRILLETEFVWFMSRVAAELQKVFGIIVFSALIFVAIYDAAFIFLRYAASCAVCRVVVLCALALSQTQTQTPSHTSIPLQTQTPSQTQTTPPTP